MCFSTLHLVSWCFTLQLCGHGCHASDCAGMWPACGNLSDASREDTCLHLVYSLLPRICGLHWSTFQAHIGKKPVLPDVQAADQACPAFFLPLQCSLVSSRHLVQLPALCQRDHAAAYRTQG